MSIAKCYMGALEQSFLEFPEQPVKLKIFLFLVNSQMLKQNGQIRRIKFFLIKMFQRRQEVLIKYSKSIEEIMQAIGF